jgi:hypothetical protein
MRRLLLLAACLLAPIWAVAVDESAPQEILVTPDQKATHKAVVSIKIDPLSSEQIKAGLSIEDLRKTIQDQLELSGIQIDDSITQPLLMLRIRTIESGFDLATFFQLSLHEESMLVRNRCVFNAITWSQASMLCCRPEDLKKEAAETVTMMVQTFAKEYLKSLQTQ